VTALTEFVLYAPTVARPGGMADLAPRPTSLEGKTVGILFNSKVNADVYLERIQELIAEKYSDVQFVYQAKPTATWPMKPENLDVLRDCDVVVNAFGD
jgi:hypothetical protein